MQRSSGVCSLRMLLALEYLLNHQMCVAKRWRGLMDRGSAPAPQGGAVTARILLKQIAGRWLQEIRQVPTPYLLTQEQWRVGGSKHPRAEGPDQAVPVLHFRQERVAAKVMTPHLQAATPAFANLKHCTAHPQT